MKCRFHNCENEPGNHNYPAVYNNSCKECLDIYFSYEAFLHKTEIMGFKPEFWEKNYKNG